jgi:hypothetical protein
MRFPFSVMLSMAFPRLFAVERLSSFGGSGDDDRAGDRKYLRHHRFS